MLIEIKNAIGNTEMVICAVPFLRDRDIRQSIAGESFDERVSAIKEGISDFYREMAQLVNPFRNQQIPIIATGHLFVTGAVTSESERELYVGNLDRFTADQFPTEFDYIALGHIHRPQKIGNSNTIRYAGAPLPLGFGERNDQKELILLEIKDGKIESIEPVQVPVFRKIIQLKGNLLEIKSSAFAIKHTFDLLKPWVEIILQESEYNPSILTELDEWMETVKDFDILNYKIILNGGQKTDEHGFEEQVSLRDLKVEAVFERLLDKQGITKKEDLQKSFVELVDWHHQKQME
jgi:exonuclease SbcD